MSDGINNLKFSTKSIMITDRQKEFISNLIDELMDYDDYRYANLEYWKLSKKDAKILINELISVLDDYRYDTYKCPNCGEIYQISDLSRLFDDYNCDKVCDCCIEERGYYR